VGKFMEFTLQGINISHLGKENHLQNAIFWGYVSSLEGISVIFLRVQIRGTENMGGLPISHGKLGILSKIYNDLTAVYLFSEANQVYMDAFCCYLVTYLCITTGEREQGILMTCA